MDLFSQLFIYHKSNILFRCLTPNHTLNILLYMYWSVYDFLLHMSDHVATQAQMGVRSKKKKKYRKARSKLKTDSMHKSLI